MRLVWKVGVAVVACLSMATGVFASCVVPPSGVVAWWPFEDGSGSAVTDSAGLHDGTLVGGATFIPGVVDMAVGFNGVSSSVFVNDQATLDFATGDFSVEFWVWFNDLSSNGNGILHKDDFSGTPTYRGWLFNICDGCVPGGVGLETRNLVGGVGSDTNARWPTANFSTGRWYHLAGVRESGSLRLYVDGVLRSTSPEAAPTDVSNSHALEMGKLSDASPQHLSGRLDEVTIYDRALGDEEVAAIYASSAEGKCRCPYASDGTECDDGNDCTLEDNCQAGSCVGGADLDCDDGVVCTVDTCTQGSGCVHEADDDVCGACRACDVDDDCVAALVEDGLCTDVSVTGPSPLLLRDKSKDKADLFVWKWVAGEDVDAEDFGDPSGGDDYELCFFDTAGPITEVVMRARIPASGTCGTKPCWKGLGKPAGAKGFRFVDSEGLPDGVVSARLKPGLAGKARIGIKAKGEDLVLPGENLHAALPLPDPVSVRMQLRGGAGCWETAYGEASVKKNTDALLRLLGP